MTKTGAVQVMELRSSDSEAHRPTHTHPPAGELKTKTSALFASTCMSSNNYS